MYDKVFVHLWMHLPRNERDRIAYVFDLNKTGITEIKDEAVITDGYNQGDLMGITAEKMETYVGSTASFNRLWELTCAKAHAECNPPVGLIAKNEAGDNEIQDVPPMKLKTQPEAILGSTEDTSDIINQEKQTIEIENQIQAKQLKKNAKNKKA